MKVIIKEEGEETGGHYQAMGDYLDIPASTGDHTFDYSFPMPISLYSAEFATTSENIGDNIKTTVGPDTIIGTIGAAVSATDTVITVSSTVIANFKVGRCLKLDDGTNADDLGRCLSIDEGASTVTMETGAVNAFAVATPTYCKMTSHLIWDYHVGVASRFTLGESKIGSSYVPANTIIRYIYTNNDGAAKKFHFHLEYTY